MAKTNNFNLEGFTLQPDGSYKKAKTVQQPREKSQGQIFSEIRSEEERLKWNKSMSIERKGVIVIGGVIKTVPPKRKLTLTLFGEPMPKQSVRASNGHFWQPQKTVDRKKDYIKQIREQLPKDFSPFMTEVFVTKFHCIYPPLKGFHKSKGKMDAIRNGEIFYKNTQPDLIDNLKKLVFDCLGKDSKTKLPIVLGNDGIIVGEDNTRKYYGVGGCIILEMEGY